MPKPVTEPARVAPKQPPEPKIKVVRTKKAVSKSGQVTQSYDLSMKSVFDKQTSNQSTQRRSNLAEIWGSHHEESTT